MNYICTRRKAFGTESDVTKYAHNEGPCPQIDESESVHLSNLSSEFVQEKEAATLIEEIWKAGNEIFGDNTRVLPSLAYDNLRNQHGVSNINNILSSLLDRDPKRRLSADQTCLLLAANHIQAVLETKSVFNISIRVCSKLMNA